MENLPKIIKKDGFLRIQLPNGELLPEVDLIIKSNVDNKHIVTVTVEFLVKLDDITEI